MGVTKGFFCGLCGGLYGLSRGYIGLFLGVMGLYRACFANSSC